MAQIPVIVICGLPASGKSTLIHRLAERDGVVGIPEHVEWMGGSRNLPPPPMSISEKKAKQDLFVRMDLERDRFARAQGPDVELVVADSDFTAVLAHNYAERWLYPDLDVYPWLVERYVGLLEAEELVPASGYLYLDVTLEQRVERRKKEWPDRLRNDVFFQGRFPERMRRFYWMLWHPDSERRSLDAHWHAHTSPLDDAWDGLVDVISNLSVQRHGPCLESLIKALRATVDDPPV